MFQKLAVGKILEVAESFGRNFSLQFRQSKPLYAARSDLAVVFDRTLVAVAQELNTDTAHEAVAKIRPQIKRWLS